MGRELGSIGFYLQAGELKTPLDVCDVPVGFLDDTGFEAGRDLSYRDYVDVRYDSRGAMARYDVELPTVYDLVWDWVNSHPFHVLESDLVRNRERKEVARKFRKGMQEGDDTDRVRSQLAYTVREYGVDRLVDLQGFRDHVTVRTDSIVDIPVEQEGAETTSVDVYRQD